MSRLFEPLRLRNLVLPNRVVIAPMCQYSAVGGCAVGWHALHLGHLAFSGAGLLLLEATAVEPAGRISRECLGLYSEANEEALAAVLRLVRQHSTLPIGIQLGHAGRKASTRKPGDGRGALTAAEGAWQTVGPSAVPFGEGWSVPSALDRAGMDRIAAAFVRATARAARLGFDAIEIHAAHGYLLSSFLSPIANRREDRYGGTLENRMRFPLEVFAAVRQSWPAGRPLGIRINGTDWDERGISPDEAVAFARALRPLGCDIVDVSSGGNVVAPVPSTPGYQVPFAARVKAEAGIATIAVGLIRDPHHAEAIVASGQADMVALARGILNDPRWPWHAAEDLGATVAHPPQYARAITRTGVAPPDARQPGGQPR